MEADDGDDVPVTHMFSHDEHLYCPVYYAHTRATGAHVAVVLDLDFARFCGVEDVYELVAPLTKAASGAAYYRFVRCSRDGVKEAQRSVAVRLEHWMHLVVWLLDGRGRDPGTSAGVELLQRAVWRRLLLGHGLEDNVPLLGLVERGSHMNPVGLKHRVWPSWRDARPRALYDVGRDGFHPYADPIQGRALLRSPSGEVVAAMAPEDVLGPGVARTLWLPQHMRPRARCSGGVGSGGGGPASSFETVDAQAALDAATLRAARAQTEALSAAVWVALEEAQKEESRVGISSPRSSSRLRPQSATTGVERARPLRAEGEDEEEQLLVPRDFATSARLALSRSYRQLHPDAKHDREHPTAAIVVGGIVPAVVPDLVRARPSAASGRQHLRDPDAAWQSRREPGSALLLPTVPVPESSSSPSSKRRRVASSREPSNSIARRGAISPHLAVASSDRTRPAFPAPPAVRSRSARQFAVEYPAVQATSTSSSSLAEAAATATAATTISTTLAAAAGALPRASALAPVGVHGSHPPAQTLESEKHRLVGYDRFVLEHRHDLTEAAAAEQQPDWNGPTLNAVMASIGARWRAMGAAERARYYSDETAPDHRHGGGDSRTGGCGEEDQSRSHPPQQPPSSLPLPPPTAAQQVPYCELHEAPSADQGQPPSRSRLPRGDMGGGESGREVFTNFLN